MNLISFTKCKDNLENLRIFVIMTSYPAENVKNVRGSRRILKEEYKIRVS